MPRVFVVGAYVPHGGTFMAYHVGRVLATRFGYEPVAVAVGKEAPGASVFRYPDQFPSIDLARLAEEAGARDLAVINPSFSQHMLGLRLKCRKISYVQGFSTFRVLDGFFDLYVSASQPVRRFLRDIYGLRTTVVPPFIDGGGGGEWLPWGDRSSQILALRKGGAAIDAVLAEVVRRYDERHGGLGGRIAHLQPQLPHAELLRTMRRIQFVLPLYPCEGFGLMPLEAMQAGCTVVGFDGVGGRDYMRDGWNSAVTSYPDIDGLVQRLHRVLSDARYASRLAERGQRTAKHYGIERFYDAWTRILSRFIPLQTC